MRGKAWPQERRDRFTAMWNAGTRTRIMAEEFGITTSSVSARAGYMGLARRRLKRPLSFSKRLDISIPADLLTRFKRERRIEKGELSRAIQLLMAADLERTRVTP